MAENLIRSWFARLRGGLAARPCPYRFAWVLDLPMRSWSAGAEKILGAFDLRAGERVLEIGPGTGFYAIDAARRVGPEGVFFALDIQLPMLVELRRRNAEAGGAPMRLLQASAAALPLRAASLDHVYLTAVLGEIPDRKTALGEIRRVLRPAGRMSVSEQLPDPDYVTLRTLRRELGPLGLVEVESRGRWVYTSTWTVSDQKMTAPAPATPPAAPRAVLLLPIAVVLHIAEEWFGGFRAWSATILGSEIGAERFLSINALGVAIFVAGALAAFLSPRMAWCGVALAALIGLNALLHGLASLVTGSYSPGTVTGLLLYLPLSAFLLGWAARRLSRPALAGAIGLGVLVHALATSAALL